MLFAGLQHSEKLQLSGQDCRSTDRTVGAPVVLLLACLLVLTAMLDMLELCMPCLHELCPSHIQASSPFAMMSSILS